MHPGGVCRLLVEQEVVNDFLPQSVPHKDESIADGQWKIKRHSPLYEASIGENTSIRAHRHVPDGERESPIVEEETSSLDGRSCHGKRCISVDKAQLIMEQGDLIKKRYPNIKGEAKE